MLKATLQGAVLLGLLVWSAPGFAEVQNVRVGGQVNVRGFHRKSLRLSEDVFHGTGAGSTSVVGTATGAGADFGSGEDNFLQQLTAVNLNADLTENVGAQLRLLNQRVWGSVAADATDTSDGDANNVDVGLANVTLKELFYSPLTLTLGRQPLWFGRGFIVGSRLLVGDADPSSALAADEYTDITGFDAIRATMDLGGVAAVGLPAVVDVVYAKVDESAVSVSGDTDSGADDLNLVGVNVGTSFDNGEAEVYFFSKRDNDIAAATGTYIEDDPQANTLGVRGSVAPVAGSDIWGEFAYQWGNRITTAIAFDAEGVQGSPYAAWAANLGTDYTIQEATWTPTVGGEWIFFSGDNGSSEGTNTGSALGGWDAVFRGKFGSALREFQGAGFYMPAQSGATVGGTFNEIPNSSTNQHQLLLHGEVRPMEDLSIDNTLSWFVAHRGIRATADAKRKHYIGTEWDVVTKYDYTDDVQVEVLYALFRPGHVFRAPYDDPAQELVTSVNVNF